MYCPTKNLQTIINLTKIINDKYNYILLKISVDISRDIIYII